MNSADPAPQARIWQPVEWLGIALAYLALALVATYPLIRHIATHVVGAGDTLNNIWNLWWLPWAVTHRLNPFYSHMLYHPDGVTLAYHTLSPFNGFLSLVLHAGLGLNLVTTYNVITLFTFVASGLSTAALAHHVSGSRMGAFIAGIVFAFSPYRLSRVYYGHFILYATQFVPLVTLFLIRLAARPRWRDAACAACALALTAWCSLELAFGAALFGAMLGGFGLFETKHRASYLKQWLIFLLLTLLLTSPLLVAMWDAHHDYTDQTTAPHAAISNSVDLLGFVVPDQSTVVSVLERSALAPIARAIRGVNAAYAGNPGEKQAFVGYAVLIITGFAVVTGGAVIRKWVALAAVPALLALGPVMHVAGRVYSALPYSLFFHIPLIGFGRSPNRLALLVTLALAVVVALACAMFERHRLRLRWVAFLAGAIIFVEYLAIPMRVDDRMLRIPEYYYELARETGTGAILDVPIDLYGAPGPASSYMLYQTVHQRPIVGGYISRTPTKALHPFGRPFLYALRARIYDDTEPYAFSPDNLGSALDDLMLLDVEYVILHKDEVDEPDETVLHDTLVDILGAPLRDDVLLSVWKID